MPTQQQIFSKYKAGRSYAEMAREINTQYHVVSWETLRSIFEGKSKFSTYKLERMLNSQIPWVREMAAEMINKNTDHLPYLSEHGKRSQYGVNYKG